MQLDATATLPATGSKRASQTEVLIAVVVAILLVTMVVCGLVWHRSQRSRQLQSARAQAEVNRLLSQALVQAQGDFKLQYPTLTTAPIEQIPAYVKETMPILTKTGACYANTLFDVVYSVAGLSS